MNVTTRKTALITGASSGIGQELANLFAQNGYDLVLVARSDETLERLADVFRGNYGTQQITVIGKDLSTEDAAQAVYDQLKAQNITVDVLVNDAGVGVYGLFGTETDWEHEKAMIHLNVLALTQMTKLFLPEMLARNEGKILNLASLLSITPSPLMAVYAGTKAYVYTFTQSLINELKDTNVTVTALLPNATKTDFFRKAGAQHAKLTDDLEDPVEVAKDGYDALMAGKHKVIPGGLRNKSYEILSYVAPQESLASTMRSKLEQKLEPEKNTSSASGWGVGFGVALLAGAALGIAYANASDLTRARFRYMLKFIGNTVATVASSAASDLAEAVVDASKRAQANVSALTDNAEGLEEEVEEAVV